MTTTVSELHMASQLLECVRDTYFFQHVTKPTRYLEGNEWSLLDLIFTNEDDMVTDIKFSSELGKRTIWSLILVFYVTQKRKQKHTT